MKPVPPEPDVITTVRFFDASQGAPVCDNDSAEVIASYWWSSGQLVRFGNVNFAVLVPLVWYRLSADQVLLVQDR